MKKHLPAIGEITGIAEAVLTQLRVKIAKIIIFAILTIRLISLLMNLRSMLILCPLFGAGFRFRRITGRIKNY